jgi:purine-binding chemotaxis protein CheW
MIDILTFELGGQRCAILASEALEIQRAVAMARLPGCPAIVEGVIDLRGKLVPVLAVRSCFELPASPVALSDQLVFARVRRRDAAGDRVVALRVDRALNLMAVPRAAIEDARGAVPGVDHLAGVAKLPDGLVLIHDLCSFLSLDDERELECALAGPGSR